MVIVEEGGPKRPWMRIGPVFQVHSGCDRIGTIEPELIQRGVKGIAFGFDIGFFKRPEVIKSLQACVSPHLLEIVYFFCGKIVCGNLQVDGSYVLHIHPDATAIRGAAHHPGAGMGNVKIDTASLDLKRSLILIIAKGIQLRDAIGFQESPEHEFAQQPALTILPVMKFLDVRTFTRRQSGQMCVERWLGQLISQGTTHQDGHNTNSVFLTILDININVYVYLLPGIGLAVGVGCGVQMADAFAPRSVGVQERRIIRRKQAGTAQGFPIAGVDVGEGAQQDRRIFCGAGHGASAIPGVADGHDAGSAPQSLGGFDADEAVGIGGADDRAPGLGTDGCSTEIGGHSGSGARRSGVAAFVVPDRLDDGADELGLACRVLLPIVGIAGAQRFLEPAVMAGQLLIADQGIAKDDIAVPVAAAQRYDVKMFHAYIRRGIQDEKVAGALPFQAEVDIAHVRQCRLHGVQISHVLQTDDHIDDRLGRKARHRRAAYMLNLAGNAAARVAEPFTLGSPICDPGVAVARQFDGMSLESDHRYVREMSNGLALRLQVL